MVVRMVESAVPSSHLDEKSQPLSAPARRSREMASPGRLLTAEGSTYYRQHSSRGVPRGSQYLLRIDPSLSIATWAICVPGTSLSAPSIHQEYSCFIAARRRAATSDLGSSSSATIM